MGDRLRSWAVGASLLAASLALLVLALSGQGVRLGWWHFGTGFQILRYGAYGGAATIALALVSLLLARRERRALALSLAALATGVFAVAVPLTWQERGRTLPAIHDITTDTENPPAFRAVLAEREAERANPAAHDGAAVAALQHEAYPDIAPVQSPAAPNDAFLAALEAAEDLGWRVVYADLKAGRIEATATTRWFGFKDDVVVRLRPAAGGRATRIDVRSKSRTGRHDFGTNAERVRAFLARVKKLSG